MSITVRSALGVALIVVCLGLAVFSAIHGVLFGTLLATFTAGLFAWAVYDNRRIARSRREPGAE